MIEEMAKAGCERYYDYKRKWDDLTPLEKEKWIWVAKEMTKKMEFNEVLLG